MNQIKEICAFISESVPADLIGWIFAALAALGLLLKMFQAAEDLHRYPCVSKAIDKVSLYSGVLAVYAAGWVAGEKINQTYGGPFGVIVTVAVSLLIILFLGILATVDRSRLHRTHQIAIKKNIHSPKCECNCERCTRAKTPHEVNHCNCTCTPCTQTIIPQRATSE